MKSFKNHLKILIAFGLLGFSQIQAQCTIQHNAEVSIEMDCQNVGFSWDFSNTTPLPITVESQTLGNIVLNTTYGIYWFGSAMNWYQDSLIFRDANGCVYMAPDSLIALSYSPEKYNNPDERFCNAGRNIIYYPNAGSLGNSYYELSSGCYISEFLRMPDDMNNIMGYLYEFSQTKIDGIVELGYFNTPSFNDESEVFNTPNIKDYGFNGFNVAWHRNATWQWTYEGVPIINSDTTWLPLSSPGGFYECMVLANDLGCIYQSNPYLHNGNEISGKIFFDLNNNGLMDSGDRPFESGLVSIPGGYMGLSQNSGDFTLRAPAGTHNLSFTPPNHFQTTASHSATFPTNAGNTDVNNNYPLTAIGNVTDLSISAYASRFRPGFSAYVYADVKNIGNQDANASVTITLDPNFTYSTAVPLPTSVNGQTLTFNLGTIQFMSEKSITIIGSIAPTVPISTIITNNYSVTTSGDINTTNNSTSTTTIVTGSFDPNDKLVSPSGNVTTSQVAAGQFLEYTIRFQNTGTDTAFRVVLVDTLSSNVDLNTLEIIDASHRYDVNIFSGNTMSVTFPEILLPTKSQNEAASQGFFRYKIKMKNTLQVNDSVTNTAHIYFDFNSPIVTNTTVTKVSNLSSIDKSESKLTLFPNPVHDLLKIEGLNGLNTFNIYNSDGKLILSGSGNKVNLSSIPSGMYLIEIKNNNQVWNEKFVKE